MDPLARHLLTQAFHNAWANHRLLGACAQLTQAQFEAPRTGFFPSTKATLNHHLTVDSYHLDALERSVAGRDAHALTAAQGSCSASGTIVAMMTLASPMPVRPPPSLLPQAPRAAFLSWRAHAVAR